MARDYRMNADYQRNVRDLVDREVHYRVSQLISALQQARECWDAMELDEDEMYRLNAQDDWETPGIEHIENSMDRDELTLALYMNDVWSREQLDAEADANVHTEVELQKLLIAGIDDWEKFGREERLDPDQREVYEHWIVSDWLARKLADRGEVVNQDFLGLTIWGRCTTGQSICMDGVIESIYDELHPEEVEKLKTES